MKTVQIDIFISLGVSKNIEKWASVSVHIRTNQLEEIPRNKLRTIQIDDK